MKKNISFIKIILASIILLAGIFSSFNEIKAQNIGSLRSTVVSGFSFKKDLQYKDTDPDIKQLQTILNADIDTVVATDGDGASGKETNYFGTLTKAAVIKFQNKYKDSILTPAGLTTGNGLVNKLTRTKLNLLLGVMTTSDSVGLPQNRPSTVVARPSTPVANVVVNNQPTMTTCDFVNLLINIGVISSDKANPARSAMGCQAVNGALVPALDLRVNNSSGPVNINAPAYVTIQWNSANVTACTSGSVNAAKALSGVDSFYANTSGTINMVCTGPYGSVTDSVTINVGTANDTPMEVSCSADKTNITVGDSLVWNATVTGGSGSYTYEWSGDMSGTNKIASKQYNVVGLKTAIVKVTSGSRTATASCMASVNATATSTPVTLPNPLQAICIATPSVVNIGANVIWSAVTSGGLDAKSYYWPADRTLATSTTSFSKTYTTTGYKMTQLVVTSGSMIASNVCLAEVVDPNVVVVSTSTSAMQVSCSATPTAPTVGSPVTWSASVSGSSTSTKTYSWEGTDNLISATSTFSKTYTTTGAKAATVTVTAGGLTAVASCGLTVSTTTAATTTPTSLQVSCSATPANAAIGSPVKWLATALGGNASTTYAWTGDDGLSAATSSFFKSYSLSGLKWANVTAYTPVASSTDTLTAANNCSVTVGSSTTTAPEAVCFALPSTASTNEAVTWTVVPRGGTGSFTYSWSGTDGLSGSGASFAKNYSSAGSKTGNVTVTSGGLSTEVSCYAVVNDPYSGNASSTNNGSGNSTPSGSGSGSQPSSGSGSGTPSSNNGSGDPCSSGGGSGSGSSFGGSLGGSGSLGGYSGNNNGQSYSGSSMGGLLGGSLGGSMGSGSGSSSGCYGEQSQSPYGNSGQGMGGIPQMPPESQPYQQPQQPQQSNSQTRVFAGRVAAVLDCTNPGNDVNPNLKQVVIEACPTAQSTLDARNAAQNSGSTGVTYNPLLQAAGSASPNSQNSFDKGYLTIPTSQFNQLQLKVGSSTVLGSANLNQSLACNNGNSDGFIGVPILIATGTSCTATSDGVPVNSNASSSDPELDAALQDLIDSADTPAASQTPGTSASSPTSLSVQNQVLTNYLNKELGMEQNLLTGEWSYPKVSSPSLAQKPVQTSPDQYGSVLSQGSSPTSPDQYNSVLSQGSYPVFGYTGENVPIIFGKPLYTPGQPLFSW